MKRALHFTICFLLLGFLACAAKAAFTSMYVFGDGVSTMTSNIVAFPLATNYYGRRSSNGRVWVEVLAQRQGLTLETNKNFSFFGQYSSLALTNIANFSPPVDVGTALFVVWVNDADFVYDIQNYSPYSTNNLAAWTNAINQSLSNHYTIIQTLYNKGVRSLVMPNAVDLTKSPGYVGLPNSSRSFIRQRVTDFNTGFATRLNQARAAFPNLFIHSPDFFRLLDDLIAHSSSYGLTNALDDRGLSIDALDDPNLPNTSLNGPGTNYIFWDYLDPTAKAHEVVADVAEQIISPTRVSNLNQSGGNCQLTIANVPVGLNGFVDTSTNFLNWLQAQSFASTNVTQTVNAPASGEARIYRLRFPFAWTWP